MDKFYLYLLSILNSNKKPPKYYNSCIILVAKFTSHSITDALLLCSEEESNKTYPNGMPERRENLLSCRVCEKSGSSAEVDFVYPFEGSLYPIETKAGKTGTLRSLHEFMDASQLSVAFRLYAEKAKTDRVNTRSGKSFTLFSLPYYLAGRIEAFIAGISGAD